MWQTLRSLHELHPLSTKKVTAVLGCFGLEESAVIIFGFHAFPRFWKLHSTKLHLFSSSCCFLCSSTFRPDDTVHIHTDTGLHNLSLNCLPKLKYKVWTMEWARGWPTSSGNFDIVASTVFTFFFNMTSTACRVYSFKDVVLWSLTCCSLQHVARALFCTRALMHLLIGFYLCVHMHNA